MINILSIFPLTKITYFTMELFQDEIQMHKMDIFLTQLMKQNFSFYYLNYMLKFQKNLINFNFLKYNFITFKLI